MQKNNRIRLVIDVNNWISALLSLKFRTRINSLFASEFRLVVSEELLGELANTVRKPHLEKQIIRTNYDSLVSLLRTDAEHVAVHSTVEICRDPKDNFLLALAKDGNADYLITGDGDLLVLKEFENTKIVTLSDFESVLSAM
jgi:putative PIN family toxin of toxin-antitoxin system